MLRLLIWISLKAILFRFFPFSELSSRGEKLSVCVGEPFSQNDDDLMCYFI